MTSVQIVPIDDSKPHHLNQYCDCKPVVEFVNGVKIVRHNSYDLREIIEEANAILRNPQTNYDNWEIIPQE